MPWVPKSHCPKGHEIAVVGRDKDKRCRGCRKERDKAAWQKIRDYKVEQGCSICGYNRCSSALHFHHRDRTEKEYCVSAVKETGTRKLWKEIEKCEVLCANCHAEVEWGVCGVHSKT